MSIIADALKKVQFNLEKNKPVQKGTGKTDRAEAPSITRRTTVPTTPSAQPADNKQLKKKKEKLLIALCSIVCIVLLILFGIVIVQFAKDRQPQRAPTGPVAAQPVVKSYSNGYLIEGIMTRPDNTSMVLINNEIYEVGDIIGSMTILSISPDHITVEENGRQRILKVNERYR